MSSSAACAKCRRGAAAEGDSWCLGCLALENTLASLKANWWSASHRRLAEEICVQAAKQLRAVKNLDTSLQSFADSCEARLKKASASSGARRPPKPPHPPRSRPTLTEAAVVPPVVKQEEVQQEAPARSGFVQPDSPGSEPDWEAEEGASRSDSEGGRKPSTSPAPTGVEDHRQSGGTGYGAGRREAPLAEHRARSRSRERRRHRGLRPGHRGGAKHQNRYRDLHQPGAVRHRAWKEEQVRLGHRSSRAVLDEDI